MNPAYEEGYLNEAMTEMGDMVDFAVNVCGFDMDSFFMLFINSGIAEKIEHGNPKYLGGMSGAELAIEVFRCTTGTILDLPAALDPERTDEYWVGWFMAYTQWRTGYTFRMLVESGMTLAHIHTMYIEKKSDVGAFSAEARKLVMEAAAGQETNLKRIRRYRGISQRELSERSGVTLRMVQLYEQRQNDINKAQAKTVADLAQALGCRTEDLLEAN
jgi:DNA-binding transcriptional regulator YiaG